MAHSIKIKGVETAYSQASKKDFLEVTTEVFEGEVSKGIRKFGYDLDVTKEYILADLDKVAKTLDSDAKLAAESAALEAGLANAKALKKSLLE